MPIAMLTSSIKLSQLFSTNPFLFLLQIVLAAVMAVAAAAPGYLGASPYLAGPAVLPGYAAAPLVKGYGHPLAYGAYPAAPLGYAGPAIVKSPIVAPAPLVASPALYKSPVLAAPYGLHGAHLGYAGPYAGHYLG